ncbi:sarcosine dehydrogenase, mitochondrial-like protein [Plakobranchus ocellatus]|uniref:Sarcosine dehydrogenase, mitochondrial-like protein n=1 Tax=Plakobranchus ocellatus TaxID=259542 RepID=A0AAV4E2Z2_9GAST|nr:sarcosine dehydrogenase, mitochondrial-like protein [Plakobranchus ocellatus]
MNRRTASTFDSDDSESDWDTTVADSPTRKEPVTAAPPPIAIVNSSDPDATYATVVAKPRVSLRGSGDDAPSSLVNGRSPATSPRNSEGNKNSVASPPPHLTSFKNALTDDMPDSPETAPSLPPRRYEEGKGQLYTVPESDLMPQADIVNWDDSDADERVLKELRQNIGKEKLRQQQLKHQQQQQQQQQQLKQQSPVESEKKTRERKVTLAAPGEHMLVQSPKTTKSDLWRQHPERASPPVQKISDIKLSKGDNKHNVTLSAPVTSPVMLDDGQPSVLKPHGGPGFGKASPVFVSDTEGKRYIFYFEEGSPHFVEVEDDDVGAFLPGKIEELERLFRRVWREVFAVLRVITSFFVLFVSELLRFLLHSVVRTLVLDTVVALGDQLLKPLLTVLYNAVLQPVFAITWNICNSVFHAVDPLIRLSGVVLSQVAMVLGAFRLFVINYNPASSHSKDVNIV